MSTETQLAIVPPKETALAVFSAPNGLDPWLQDIRVKIDDFIKVIPDTKTKKGRDAIASMAFTITKSKTALEEVGKNLSAEQKLLPKKIDAERRRVWDLLELWQKEVRKPLDEWQAAEDKRIDDHQDALIHLRGLSLFAEPPTAARIEQLIEEVQLVTLDDSWQEFLTEAGQVKDQVLTALCALLVQRQQYEAEQVELARLRTEAEARAKEDHEAEISRAAVTEAQRVADQAAQAEREASAKREQVLIDQVAQAKRDVEQAVRDADAIAANQALQIKLQAEQAITAAALIETNRIAAGQQAEQERVASAKRQAQAVEDAKQAEIDRQAVEAEEARRQTAAREADVANKTAVLTAAKLAMIEGGVSEECARMVINLIRAGKVPNITIAY